MVVVVGGGGDKTLTDATRPVESLLVLMCGNISFAESIRNSLSKGSFSLPQISLVQPYQVDYFLRTHPCP